MPKFTVLPEAAVPQRKKRNRVSAGYVPKGWYVCSNCGKGFLREMHIMRQRRKHPMSKGELQFCTKSCQGKWLGKNYGGSNRKNAA